MTGTKTQLLGEQLKAALHEREAGDGEDLEVAALAGLLQRGAPDDPLLADLDVEVAADELAAALEDAADAVLATEEDDDPAESWDVLLAFDELCAAARWLDRPALAERHVDEVVSIARAFPELWRVHSGAATDVLQGWPSASSDPARRLWAAIEASDWEAEDEDPPREAPIDLKLRHGLAVVVSLAPFRAATERLAAASGVAEAPPWERLGRGPGWELALTVDDADRPTLLLAGDAEATFVREGVPVEPSRTAEGRFCPAAPGRWEVTVGERVLRFEVRE